MEKTAKEIIALGGELPLSDEQIRHRVLISEMKQEKLKFSLAIWKDRIITTMNSIAKPYSARENSEVLLDEYNDLTMSTIYPHVSKTLLVFNSMWRSRKTN